MNISEVYIGPWFVGVLALVIVALPMAPEIVEHLRPVAGQADKAGLVGNAAFGALLLAFAYLIGVVLDRAIDTVLDPLDRHNRLKFACGRLDPGGRSVGDPFPEGRLRASALLNMPDAANALLDGLRTRIRLMRTAAFMFPAVAFASIFALARWCGLALPCGPEPKAHPFYSALALAAALIAAHRLLATPWDPSSHRFLSYPSVRNWKERELKAGRNRLIGAFDPPRTDESDRLQAYAEARGWIGRESVRQNGWTVLIDFAVSAFALYLLFLALAAAWVGWRANLPGAAYWGPATVLVSALLPLWAWWRTTGTFMGYLVLLEEARLTETRRRSGRH